MENKGFTLIELVVVVAITAILSGIILFTVTQYVYKSKDSNIYGNMTILIPAGEVFYNGNGSSYNDGVASFCNPNKNSVIKNVIFQMPINNVGDCYYSSSDSSTWGTTSTGSGSGNPAGLCCYALSQSWVACASEFNDSSKAYCVDSRGMKEDMSNSLCNNTLVQCP
jgi:prepilin-type N-terminal cleavage/methylation domain-containing protein